MWPYICQYGFRDYFWIIDAFSPNIIHRVNLPEQSSQLQEFFIYDFRIYFVLLCMDKKCYQLWSIDMREGAEKLKLSIHFEYKFEEVDSKPFFDFFVRG